MNKLILTAALILSLFGMSAYADISAYRSLDISMTDGSNMLLPLAVDMTVNFSDDGEYILILGKNTLTLDPSLVSRFSFSDQKASSFDADDPSDPDKDAVNFRSIKVLMVNGDISYVALRPEVKIQFSEQGNLQILTPEEIYSFEGPAVEKFAFSTLPGNMVGEPNRPYDPDKDAINFRSIKVLMTNGDASFVTLSPEMRIKFNDENDLLISTPNEIFTFDGPSVEKFAFSTLPGNTVGEPNIPESIDPTTAGDSGALKVHFHFDGHQVVISSDTPHKPQLLRALLFDIDGAFLSHYTGNPVIINTDALNPGTYIISTNSSSFKFYKK